MRLSEDRAKSILIIAEAVILVALLILSALTQLGLISRNSGSTGSAGASSQTAEELMAEDQNSIGETETEAEPVVEYSFDVDAVLGAMSQDQKVAQLILTTPERLTRTNRVTSAGNTTQRALQSTPVGALLYTADNYVDDEQISSLMTNTAEMVSQSTWVGAYYVVASRDGYTTPYTDAADAAEVITAIAQTEAIGDEEVDPHFDEATPDTGSIYDAITQTAGGTAVYVDGARMIYCTDNVQDMFNSINSAVSDGTIAAEDLDAAVREILEAKATD